MANIRWSLYDVTVSYPSWGYEFKTTNIYIKVEFEEIRGFFFAEAGCLAEARSYVRIYLRGKKTDIELEDIKLDEGDVVPYQPPFPWTVKIQAHFDKYLKSKLKDQTQTQNLTQIQQRLDKLEDTFGILANLLTRVDEQQK